MDIREVRLEDDGKFTEFEADVVFDILLEDVDFSIEFILIFTVIERGFEFLYNFQIGIEEETLTEILQI
jgi:hypothetical protein